VTTLISMTLPDDPARLADWLEENLAAGEVRRLAAELSAIHGPGAEGVSLEDVCGPHLERVYQQGLGVLPRPVLQRLLQNPRLLLELAEQVLMHGGRYWDERFAAAPSARIEVAESWSRLNAALDAERGPVTLAAAEPTRRRWYSAPWFVAPLTALATAACVLGFLRFAPTQERWGWLKVDDLPRNATAADHLEGIAALADEWQTRQAGSPQALADDILALRRGCDRLQLMAHPQLSPAQTADLLSRCRKWAAKFDAELAELEATRDVDRIRSAVTETVKTLSAALRAEANRLRREQAQAAGDGCPRGPVNS
jgi:hypothetical protein